MNLFIPMTKDRFRVLKEIPGVVYDSNYPAKLGPLPVGSIISFRRIDVTKMTKLESRVSVDIRVHFTDRSHTMKMYGGTAQYGGSFSTSYGELRTWELELAKDVP